MADESDTTADAVAERYARRLAYQRAYRAANKERLDAYRKAWRDSNPERTKAYQRKGDAKESEAFRAFREAEAAARQASSGLADERHERRKAYWRAYHAKNKERLAPVRKAYADARKAEKREYDKVYREKVKHPKLLAARCPKQPPSLAELEARAVREAATRKAYLEANRETKQAWDRAYYKANRAALLDYQRRYREAHFQPKAKPPKQTREEYLAKKKEFYRRHPERHRAYNHTRRARMWMSGGVHTASDIAHIRKAQGGRCAYCREILGKRKDYEVDHIQPLAKGGSNWPSNLQLLCKPCNRAKAALDPIDFAQSRGLLL